MSIQSDTWDGNNATWVNGGGPGLYCLNHPDETVCADVPDYYQYRVDMAPNAAFLAVFGASMIGYIVTWIVARYSTAFNVAILLGLICEVLGYAGRIMSADNPWSENGFLIQICCLTIGPAFMAAGIYLCLRRIVSAFGPENSRLPPEYYTRIFIPCDVISLILQALGGGMASVASHNKESPDAGSNIMIAGLAFQVITIVGFILASTDFALRTVRRHRALGDSALDQRPELVRVRNSRRFKACLAALGLATFCILWRSAFRVAELSEGWEGPIMGDQGMFIGFEGVLIVVAVWVLNIFHPAFCMKELFELEDGGLKGLWFLRSRKGKSTKSEISAAVRLD
ncbi:RTA1 like protein-domain-containing protein [Dactylonectria estremocensis]|uniref:RTA1 like protein-domain-containing protein n=1 Tax=Dactylonectria estremocensis TaxID=1079267 RepID=A0A9P9D530_9HYPO|nr:RTA1 like protein-domain-containing protein [Dactylonectria estremocensis]